MRVIAKEAGYYGGKRRDPGEAFEFSGAKPGSWMEPVHPLDHDEDGKKGGSKPSGKPPAAERIAAARELTGRADITTAKEADAILAAAEAGGAPDEPSDDIEAAADAAPVQADD